MDYKFKSQVTKDSLPTGYVSTATVTRAEVPIFLERIRVRAKEDGGDWIDTLIWSMLTNRSWKPETVMSRINDLHDDIRALMDLLLVKEVS